MDDDGPIFRITNLAGLDVTSMAVKETPVTAEASLSARFASNGKSNANHATTRKTVLTKAQAQANTLPTVTSAAVSVTSTPTSAPKVIRTKSGQVATLRADKQHNSNNSNNNNNNNSSSNNVTRSNKKHLSVRKRKEETKEDAGGDDVHQQQKRARAARFGQ